MRLHTTNGFSSEILEKKVQMHHCLHKSNLRSQHIRHIFRLNSWLDVVQMLNEIFYFI